MAESKMKAAVESSQAPAEVWGKVQAFIDSARQAAQDGLTLGEFAALATSLVSVAAEALESIPVEGSAKKAWVQDAVGLLFDAVADKVIPLYVYPLWLLVRSPVRSLVVAVAGGAVEAILPLLRE